MILYYIKKVENRKILLHIKNFFNDHWDNYKFKFADKKRRPIIDKVITKFLLCKSFKLDYSLYQCHTCNEKRLFLILVRLVFVLHVLTNTMKLDLYLFILNFLNPNIVMLFLLFLKYLEDT